MRSPSLVTTVRRSLFVIALVALICSPAFAQPGYQGPGSVPAGQSEAPDPGFEHNQRGRNIGDIGSVPDYGTYCGPLPSHVCRGGDYWYVLGADPFSPQVWLSHQGNAFAMAKSHKKGWPLQTVTVLLPDGTPAANAKVRFFESGYRSTGVKGTTDKEGRFQVTVKRVKRSQRFVVEAMGYQRARLDVVGREIHSANHIIVLSDASRRHLAGNVHQVAVMDDISVPKDLARDYKKAKKAIGQGKWDVAIAELTALVQRWPVGTLSDGAEYQPRALLINALTAAGEEQLAEQVERRQYEIVKAEAAG